MKKFITLAFAAIAFMACSKDNDNNSSDPILPPEEPTLELPTPQEPFILYFDAESQTLAAGQWGTVDIGNVLLFQFGSVVGFSTLDYQDSWDAGDVKFDPTENSSGYENYSDIPHYNGSKEEDGYISSAEYHTGANVKDGLGDPCKLVGLKADATAAEIDAHDSGLRLPMSAEFKEMYPDADTFVWTNTPRPGRWLASNPTEETFLPVLTIRTGSGTPAGGIVLYGSSWPNDFLDEVRSVSFSFNDEDVVPSIYYGLAGGQYVRCVRDL